MSLFSDAQALLPPVEDFDPTLTDSSIRRGLRSGSTALAGAYQGLAGNIGEVFGADQFAANRYAQAKALGEQAQREMPFVNQTSQVKGLRDAGSYIGGQIGMMGPSLLAAAPGAIAGGIVGGPVGAFIGGTATAAPGEIGGSIMRQQEDPVAAAQSAGLRLGTAAVTGTGSAALGNIVPAVMGGRLLGRGIGTIAGSRAGKVAENLFEGVAGNAASGAASEYVQQQGASYLNPNRDTSGDASELFEAAVGEAAGGLPFTGIGVASALRRGRVGGLDGAALTPPPAALPPSGIPLTDPEAPSPQGGPVKPVTDGAASLAEGFTGTPAAPIDLSTDPLSVSQFFSEASREADVGSKVAKGIATGKRYLGRLRGVTDPLEARRIIEEQDNADAPMVKKWASELLNDRTLSPESRQQIAEMGEDVLSAANRVTVATIKMTQDAKNLAVDSVNKLLDHVRSRSQADEGGATKKSMVGTADPGDTSPALRQAIAEEIIPFLEQHNPSLLRNPDALNKLADALRLVMSARTAGNVDATTIGYLQNVFGGAAARLMDTIRSKVDPRDEQMLALVNAVEEAESPKGNDVNVLLKYIDPDIADDEDLTTRDLRTHAKLIRVHLDGSGYIGDGPQARLYAERRFNEWIDKYYGENKDAVLTAFAKDLNAVRTRVRDVGEDKVQSQYAEGMDDSEMETEEQVGEEIDPTERYSGRMQDRDEGEVFDQPRYYGRNSDDSPDLVMSPDAMKSVYGRSGDDTEVAKLMQRARKEFPDNEISFVSAKDLGDNPAVVKARRELDAKREAAQAKQEAQYEKDVEARAEVLYRQMATEADGRRTRGAMGDKTEAELRAEARQVAEGMMPAPEFEATGDLDINNYGLVMAFGAKPETGVLTKDDIKRLRFDSTTYRNKKGAGERTSRIDTGADGIGLIDAYKVVGLGLKRMPRVDYEETPAQRMARGFAEGLALIMEQTGRTFDLDPNTLVGKMDGKLATVEDLMNVPMGERTTFEPDVFQERAAGMTAAELNSAMATLDSRIQQQINQDIGAFKESLDEGGVRLTSKMFKEQLKEIVKRNYNDTPLGETLKKVQDEYYKRENTSAKDRILQNEFYGVDGGIRDLGKVARREAEGMAEVARRQATGEGPMVNSNGDTPLDLQRLEQDLQTLLGATPMYSSVEDNPGRTGALAVRESNARNDAAAETGRSLPKKPVGERIRAGRRMIQLAEGLIEKEENGVVRAMLRARLDVYRDATFAAMEEERRAIEDSKVDVRTDLSPDVDVITAAAFFNKAGPGRDLEIEGFAPWKQSDPANRQKIGTTATTPNDLYARVQDKLGRIEQAGVAGKKMAEHLRELDRAFDLLDAAPAAKKAGAAYKIDRTFLHGKILSAKKPSDLSNDLKLMFDKYAGVLEKSDAVDSTQNKAESQWRNSAKKSDAATAGYAGQLAAGPKLTSNLGEPLGIAGGIDEFIENIDATLREDDGSLTGKQKNQLRRMNGQLKRFVGEYGPSATTAITDEQRLTAQREARALTKEVETILLEQPDADPDDMASLAKSLREGLFGVLIRQLPEQTRDALQNYIRRVLGSYIKLNFFNPEDLANQGGGFYVAPGSLDPAYEGKLGSIAMADGNPWTEKQTMGVMRHEAAHALFTVLNSKPDFKHVIDSIRATAQSKPVMDYFRGIYDSTRMDYMTKNPEEAMADMYAHWATGDLKIADPQTLSFFQRIKLLLDKFVNFLTDADKTEAVFSFFESGDLDSLLSDTTSFEAAVGNVNRFRNGDITYGIGPKLAKMSEADYQTLLTDMKARYRKGGALAATEALSAPEHGLYGSLSTGMMSRQAPTGPAPLTTQQEAEVRDYITKVLGPKAQTLFKDLFVVDAAGNKQRYSGDWQKMTNGADLVRISVHALNPMSTAFHESLHGFFQHMRDAGLFDVNNVLFKAANSAPVINQLRALLANEPDALKQIESSVEERAAYMYQFWAAGQLTLGDGAKGYLTRVKEYIMKMMGMWTNDQRAAHIMQYFHQGEYARDMGNKDVVAAAILQKGRNAGFDKVAKTLEGVGRLGERIIATGDGLVRGMGIEPFTEVADKIMSTKEGEKDTGFIVSQGAKFRQTMNEFYKRLGAISTNKEQYGAALQALQTKTVPTDPQTLQIYKAVRTVLDHMYDYMQEAGVSLNDMGYKKDYFPVVWDIDYISKNKKEFLAMLEKYHQSGQLKEKPELLMNRLIAANGSEFRIQKTMPGMQHIKERVLDFIDPADRAPFLNNDLLQTMSSYVMQATRRSEWVRRFGADNEGITEAIKKAEKEFGANSDQVTAFTDYLKGIDGTLGDDIDPRTRRIFGNLIVYENVRLLPLAVFSMAIDPMGILVRGGSINDAFDAFKRGIQEIPRTFQKEPKRRDGYDLAEDMGVIEASALMHAMGTSYTQGMVGSAARKINDTFFRYNLVEQMNTSMRVAATTAAVRWLVKHNDGTASSAHSKRWLAELGLKPNELVVVNGELLTKQADLWAHYRSQGMASGEARDKAVEMSARVREVVNKWVDGAVLRPNAAQKPIWMNDPHFALIAHLKQFIFSFHQTILKRVMNEVGHGNYTPAYGLAAYVPIMAASDLIRGLVIGGGSLPAYMQMWTFSDWFVRSIERAGLFGVGQFAIDSIQHTGSLAGPVLEQLGEGVASAVSGTTGNFVIESLPANALAKSFTGAPGY